MIHQFINNGTAVAVDVDPGSVYAADPALHRAIQMTESLIGEPEQPELLPEAVKEAVRKELSGEFPAEEIEEVTETMQALIDGEELFTKDGYQAFVRGFKARKTAVEALYLHITHDCNFACRYCFAEEGEYHGRRVLTNFEVDKKALDFFVASPGARRNLGVDFFGDELTMNWKVVRQLVEYGRSFEKMHDRKFRFTLTTNDVLLSGEVTAFCNKEMSNAVLSLDGQKEVNDRMHPTRSGQGSYDIIVSKFQRFTAERDREHKDYYIRGTFTHNNLEFSEDVPCSADLGFKRMSIESVVVDPTEPCAIREEDLSIILEQYDKFVTEYVKRRREGKGSVLFHFQTDLKQGPCVAKRLSGYGSGTEYLAVTPQGDFYPCHQFVSKEELLFGNTDTSIQRSDICDEPKLCNVYAKPKYKDYEMRFYCSDGCVVNSQDFHHNLADAYEIGCAMQKKRIECTVMTRAAEILDIVAAEEAKAT